MVANSQGGLDVGDLIAIVAVAVSAVYTALTFYLWRNARAELDHSRAIHLEALAPLAVAHARRSAATGSVVEIRVTNVGSPAIDVEVGPSVGGSTFVSERRFTRLRTKVNRDIIVRLNLDRVGAHRIHVHVVVSGRRVGLCYAPEFVLVEDAKVLIEGVELDHSWTTLLVSWVGDISTWRPLAGK